MAEHGAHLTSATVDTEKPSIFEVLAQESLTSTIRPALKHLVRVLSQRHPERFAWLYHLYDEVYLILDLFLQQYNLHQHCASFSEHFYGLRRISSKQKNQHSKNLPRSCHFRSLLCLAVVPYLKQKLDDKYEELLYKFSSAGSPNLSQSYQKRLCQVFIRLYPYIHMWYEGVHLISQLAYTLVEWRWHTPLLPLAGVELCMAPLETLDKAADLDLNRRNQSMTSWLLRLVYHGITMAAGSLSSCLSVGVFFLQFLDWWYASESTSAASLTALPVPQPPKKQQHTGQQSLSESQCPVCLKTRTNETTLAVSGYVFCYPCIYRYVSQNECCPVTGYPATLEHLVKLYPPD